MTESSHPGIDGHCQVCSAIKLAKSQAAIAAREERPTSSQRPTCLRTLTVTRPIAFAADREIEPTKEKQMSSQRPRYLRTLPATRPIAFAAKKARAEKNI